MDDYTPPQRSVSISEYKLDLSKFKKVKQGNKRAEAINRMTDALGIEAKYRKGLVMQTQNIITDQELEAIFSKALGWQGKTLEAKARWFRTLIRAKIEEIKKLL